jgi:hypothetical protein
MKEAPSYEQCSVVDPTLLTNLLLAKEHASMWVSIPSPSCAYLEGSLLSRFFAFPSSSSPLHRCTPPSSALDSSLASAALSLSLWWAYPLLPPLSMGQWHVEPLSTMAQICGDGPDSLFLLFGSATSGEAVRTSPRLLLAAHPLNTVVAAAEVMLLLNNAKRSGLYGASSTLPSLLSPVESSNCESGPCASRCEHCIVLSIVSSGLDGLRSPPVRSNATASSLSVSLSLYICLLCSELDGLHLQVC